MPDEITEWMINTEVDLVVHLAASIISDTKIPASAAGEIEALTYRVCFKDESVNASSG